MLTVRHSAMSVGAAWNRVATSVWWPVVETREWNCGTKCEMWCVPLVYLVHDPILVSIVAPLELGLGIHNPRFVAGPLEVGLGTRYSRFVVWPLELGLGARSPRFVAWPLELRFGIRNARSHVAMCADAPACSRRLLPSHPTPQRHAWAVSSLPMQRPYTASLLLPRPRNLPRQYQRRQQPNQRPRRQVPSTLGSHVWTGKTFPRKNLQAQRLELLMVVLCPYPVTTVAMSVRSKVAEPSDGCTTTTMLAVGGLKKLGSVSTTPVQHTCKAQPCMCRYQCPQMMTTFRRTA